ECADVYNTPPVWETCRPGGAARGHADGDAAVVPRSSAGEAGDPRLPVGGVVPAGGRLREDANLLRVLRLALRREFGVVAGQGAEDVSVDADRVADPHE